MKWISTIEKIGKKAVDSKDGMVILFGEGANEDLKDVSIIQKFNPSTPINSFIFKKGDTVTIDGQTYVANYVGPMVESNRRCRIQTCGCTIIARNSRRRISFIDEY